jgi:hypothetical protein
VTHSLTIRYKKGDKVDIVCGLPICFAQARPSKICAPAID